MPEATIIQAIAPEDSTAQLSSVAESHQVPATADATTSSTWATVQEASTFFRSSEWFMRKTCNEMAAAHVAGHPIRCGHWLINIPTMKTYLEAITESAAENSCYLNSGAADRLRVEVDPQETWGWGEDDVA